MASSEAAEAEALYRGYDRAGLETQYNLRISHPDRNAVYADYLARSMAFRAEAGGRYDVPYGPAERQRLDVFPGPTEDAPVFVFFHGGYWRALDKDHFSFLAAPFAKAGWTTVLPNYTLAPATTVDVIVDQAREAVAWVAEAFPKADRIVLSGHSTGGQLSVMCLMSDWGSLGMARPPLRAGLPISGVFDLEPIPYTTINDLVRLDAATARRMSPIRHIRRTDAPLLVAVGGKETPEFQGQSARFVEAWRAAGNRADLFTVPGKDHFTVLGALADPTNEFHDAAWNFLTSI